MANPSFKALIKVACNNRLLLVNNNNNNMARRKIWHNLQTRFPFSNNIRAIFDEWADKKGDEIVFESDERRERFFKLFEEDYQQGILHYQTIHHRHPSQLCIATPQKKGPNLFAAAYDDTISHPNPFQSLSIVSPEHCSEKDPSHPLVTKCRSLIEWEEHYLKSIQSKKLVVVAISVPICECKSIVPVVGRIAEINPQHVIVLEVGMFGLTNPVRYQFSIEAMHTLVFLKQGKEVGRLDGGDNHEIMSEITKHGATILQLIQDVVVSSADA